MTNLSHITKIWGHHDSSHDIPSWVAHQTCSTALRQITQCVFKVYVPREATGNYPALKDALLKALGISKERYQREFWFYRKKPGDTAQDAARDVETMAESMAEGCSSVEEVVKLFSFNKYLPLFPQEDAEFVQLKKPASILEAANVMEEHIWRRGPSRDGYRKQELGMHLPSIPLQFCMPHLANEPEKLLTDHHLAADCMQPELKGYPKISAEWTQFLQMNFMTLTPYQEHHPEKSNFINVISEVRFCT